MMHSLEIKVVPQSGRLALVVNASGSIKCYLKSAPEKGAANRELIAFIAKKIGVPKAAISIAKGATSRKKLLNIETPKKKRVITGIAWSADTNESFCKMKLYREWVCLIISGVVLI